MGAASWGSVISSLITYMQRLGINVSLDSVPLPDKMKEIIGTIYLFYQKIQDSIPQFPDFDLRSQLMVLALGIPFVLDVIFVWFINPISVTMTHVLDLIAFGVGTFFITASIIGGWNLTNISIICVCVVFIVLRVIFTFLTKQKNDIELYVLVDAICDYYMQGILPYKKCDLSFGELNMAIFKFSKIIEILPPRANLLNSYSFLLVSLCCFFLSFWCLDAFPIPYDFPEIVSLLLPIIGIPLGFVFFVIYVLRLFHCGRYFLMLVKQFIRRWGLRGLMMILDILYIPILTVLINLITPVHIGCPQGQYLYYQVVNKDIIYYPFVNHTTSCLPCAESEFRSNFCDRKCSGMSELRMKLAPDLLFVDDILKMTCGLIIYTLGIVMIGLPLLWYYIIRRNHQYINRINVYGENENIKYGAIIHRLHSTGVFLFQDYKSNFTLWGVALLGMKFILMILSLFCDNFSEKLIWAFPFFYTITFCLHAFLKPYLYTFNTLFESSLEFFNILFAIFTIIAYFGVNIPDVITLPFSIICLIIPILSVLLILCCEGKEGTSRDTGDPTFLRKAKTKNVTFKHHDHIAGKYIREQENNIPNKVNESDTNTLIENNTTTFSPIPSAIRVSEPKTEYYRPNTSRAHHHVIGYVSRPATPIIAVSGVPTSFPTRPHTVRVYNSDSDYDYDSDWSINNDIKVNKSKFTNEIEIMDHKENTLGKHRHHHNHNNDKIEIDAEGIEHIISSKIELEEGFLDSINEFRERKKDESDLQTNSVTKKCFTIQKNSAAKRMTKMYKTLDIVLDGSTVDKLTKILNNAVIIGVIAVGWYLGALMTTYSKSQNFSC